MNFIIVESPSKCQKIKYFLQTGNPSLSFDVRGCCGHFREIVSIDPNTFDVTFQIMKEKKNIYKPFPDPFKNIHRLNYGLLQIMTEKEKQLDGT